jgi:dimethylglycine dehydrogenase
MRCRPMFVGHAEVMAMCVSFSGELAYELHVPNEQLYLVYKTLSEAGDQFGLRDFGLYATESMRVEKGYRHWKADLIYEHNPMESGLERFVKLDKADFIGRDALLMQIERGPTKLFVSMVVECDFAAVHGGEGVYLNGQQIGSVTSGAYGHRTQKNIAFAFIQPEHAAIGTTLEIEMLGQQINARIVEGCLYDPDNKRVRA